MHTVRAMVGLAIAVAAWQAPAFAAMLNKGDQFPSWKMSDQTGATVSSASLKDKTYLIWFYPKAMTPGCTAEGRGLRDNVAAFTEQGVVIIGVSFDDPKSNAEFATKEGFPFRLLSDTNRSLAVAVGAADSTTQSVARRISYLVGPDGKVRAVYADVDPPNHASQVLRDLRQ